MYGDDRYLGNENKVSGKFHDRLNVRGLSSPVTNEATIRTVLVLMIMAAWASYLADINGAFIMGGFKNGEENTKGFRNKVR